MRGCRFEPHWLIIKLTVDIVYIKTIFKVFDIYFVKQKNVNFICGFAIHEIFFTSLEVNVILMTEIL